MNISFENTDKITVLYNKTVSHNVDPQKGFTPLRENELPISEGHLIGSELAKQNSLLKFKTLSRDIHPSNAIWIADKNNPQLSPIEGKNVDLRWNAHCMSGTEGSEILDELGAVEDYDYLVIKGVDPHLHPYTSVYQDQEKKISTGLIEWYESKDISTIVVGGLALNYCVGETVKDLSKAGFQVILNLSATKGLGTKEDLNDYIKMLKHDYNVIMIKSIKELNIVNKL